MGIRHRDYMRRPAGAAPSDVGRDDDAPGGRTPLWAKLVLALLALSLVATAIGNNV